ESLLRPGHHWLLGKDHELMQTIARAFELEESQRTAVGAEGDRYIAERHTQAHRVATLIENVKRLRESRATGSWRTPHAPYFLDDVDLATELPLAVRNWPRVAG